MKDFNFTKEEIDNSDTKLPKGSVFEAIIDNKYTNLVQDPTDLTSPNWDQLLQELPSFEKITEALIRPHLQTIKSVETKLVIPIDSETVRVISAICGTDFNSEEVQRFNSSYILKSKALNNLTFLDLECPKSPATLIEKLEPKELQLVSNPLKEY